MYATFLEHNKHSKNVRPFLLLTFLDYFKLLWKPPEFLFRCRCPVCHSSRFSVAYKIWKWLSYISILRSVCFDTNRSCHWRYEKEDPAAGSCHSPRAPWCQDASDGAAGLRRSYRESGQQNELVAAPLVLIILIFMICLHLPSLRYIGSLISTQIMFLNLGWTLLMFRTLLLMQQPKVEKKSWRLSQPSKE